MKILAEHQYNDLKKPGLTRDELYELAVDKTLISSPNQLKDCLVEFIDHKVIINKDEPDGRTYIQINFPKETLEKIITNSI